MKKEKKDLIKIQTLLENDRISTGDDFLQLVKTDLNKILQDYFEFRGFPEIKIEKAGDRYRVDFSVYISRIKTFDCLPKN